MKFGYKISTAFSEKRSFKILDGRMITGACLYYKCPGAFGLVQLGKQTSQYLGKLRYFFRCPYFSILRHVSKNYSVSSTISYGPHLLGMKISKCGRPEEKPTSQPNSKMDIARMHQW